MQSIRSTKRHLADRGGMTDQRSDQCLFDCRDDFLYKVILKSEQVTCIAVITFGPKVVAVSCVDKLSDNPYPGTAFLNAPFQEVLHTKTIGELGYIASSLAGCKT